MMAVTAGDGRGEGLPVGEARGDCGRVSGEVGSRLPGSLGA